MVLQILRVLLGFHGSNFLQGSTFPRFQGLKTLRMRHSLAKQRRKNNTTKTMGCLFQMTSSFEADPRIGSGLVDLVVAHIVGLFDGVVDRVVAHIVGLFDGLFSGRGIGRVRDGGLAGRAAS